MKNFLLVGIVFAVLLLAGCLQGQAQAGDAMEKKEVASPTDAMEKASPTPEDAMKKDGDAMVKETPATPGASTTPATSPQPAGTAQAEEKARVKYAGTVLAGSKVLLLDFNKADFEAAKQTDSLIVLYFYADWCPICKEEFPKMQAAFNEVQNENVVGFRVNYRDDFTDADEEALAREHGVPYQHTKVFLKGGERVLKSPEGWDKQRYLDEIGKAV